MRLLARYDHAASAAVDQAVLASLDIRACVDGVPGAPGGTTLSVDDDRFDDARRALAEAHDVGDAGERRPNASPVCFLDDEPPDRTV
ncbi:MAG TPA: hypothetical protein VEL07_02645 [Planctomycetota bacterium]|nr:hypothetical protein [Planctomycetota bacterium]